MRLLVDNLDEPPFSSTGIGNDSSVLEPPRRSPPSSSSKTGDDSVGDATAAPLVESASLAESTALAESATTATSGRIGFTVMNAKTSSASTKSEPKIAKVRNNSLLSFPTYSKKIINSHFSVTSWSHFISNKILYFHRNVNRRPLQADLSKSKLWKSQVSLPHLRILEPQPKLRRRKIGKFSIRSLQRKKLHTKFGDLKGNFIFWYHPDDSFCASFIIDLYVGPRG